MFALVFLLSIISTITEARVLSDESPVVLTKNGYVRGITTKTVGEELEYSAFRGIPFAEPPVGKLRFEPPVAKRDWDGVLDATKDGSSCIQGSNPVIGSEDCLFVNVYIPKHKLGRKLPVMVWIYGGAFVEGKSTYTDYAPDYFLEKQVVVVTLNYRIGVMGFISTSDTVVPGNNGLKDQVLALKWVQNNIKFFGGDPKQVTVFGGSAGSASTSYLLQSPAAQGLFSRAIMQSGVSLCLWSLTRAPADVAFAVGKKTGHQSSNTAELIQHLKSLNASTLQTAASSTASEILLNNNPRDGLVFSPVIEPENQNAILTKKSHELLQGGNISNVPIIIGFNSLEANIDITTLIRLFLFQKYDLAPSRLVPADMNYASDRDTADIIGKKIKKQYFGTKLISSADIEVKQYISDDMFVRPIREFVKQYSRRANVYYYRFAYEGGLSGVVNRSSPGAAHSEEIPYMFSFQMQPTSNNDIATRNRMVTMWTNFAKYNDPTPKADPLMENVIWLPANSVGSGNYVFLNINQTLTIDVNPEEKAMTFWDDLYADYATPPMDTY